MSIVTASTLLIRVDTEMPPEYPLRLSDMRRCFPSTFLPNDEVDSDVLAELGVFVVELTERPVADVVEESIPEFDGDVWRQVWTTRSYTPEENQSSLDGYKAKHLLNIEAWRIAQFREGFPFVHNGQTYHVQIRDTDRVNILARYTKAKEAVAAGEDTLFEFRMYENVSVHLTPQEMVVMGDMTNDKAYEGYAKTWALRDQTRDALVFEDIPQIPEKMFEDPQ